MDSKNLDKALDIYTALMMGTEISLHNKETRSLYEDFYESSEVYEITTKLLEKLNLSVYEYKESLYVTAGEGNKVFGYTNEDMKRMLGLRLNKELYMCYFIMYRTLLYFYHDSASYQVREYVRLEDLLQDVTDYLKVLTQDISIYALDENEQDSFKEIALIWDEIPVVTSDDKEKNKASRASRTGYIKLTFNFLIAQKLFVSVADRYYPTNRFHAIVTNYFEEHKGRLYEILGGTEDADN